MIKKTVAFCMQLKIERIVWVYLLLFITVLASLVRSAYVIWQQEVPQHSLVATAMQSVKHARLARLSSALLSKQSGRVVRVVSGDNLTSIFQKQGIHLEQLYAILSLGKAVDILRNLTVGMQLDMQVDSAGKLRMLELGENTTHRLRIRYDGKTYHADHITLPAQTKLTYAQMTVKSSLYQDGVKQGIEEKLLMDLSDLFGWEVDFSRDIRVGDHVEMLYETKYFPASHTIHREIVDVDFCHIGKCLRATRYAVSPGKTDYFDAKGKSLTRAFMRYPLDYRRISSRFSNNRLHPTLDIMRPHYGVDFAASTGTPVWATAAGRVMFIGVKGGYGNVLIIRHNQRYQTVYAHLSRFKTSLKVGSSVKRGQVIAYVGRTGLATGPHLHYEIRVNNQPKDPITITLPRQQSLPGIARADYRHQLDQFAALRLALHTHA